MPDRVGHDEILTIEGDTWDALALALYDDEQKASLLISANPDYCSTLIFGEGTVLKIPIVEEIETPETLPPWRRKT